MKETIRFMKDFFEGVIGHIIGGIFGFLGGGLFGGVIAGAIGAYIGAGFLGIFGLLVGFEAFFED